MGSNFLERLVRFCEILREEQFGTTPTETLDAACALIAIDISRIEDFRRALKSALVKRSEDYERFDRLFTIFWLPAGKNRQENPLGRVSIPGRKIERTLRIPDSQINQTGKGRITAGAMSTSTTPDSQDAEKLWNL